MASALRERVADIDYVDLRFDERVYVQAARRRADRDEGGSGRAIDGKLGVMLREISSRV